jgi:hypothetical protein
LPKNIWAFFHQSFFSGYLLSRHSQSSQTGQNHPNRNLWVNWMAPLSLCHNIPLLLLTHIDPMIIWMDSIAKIQVRCSGWDVWNILRDSCHSPIMEILHSFRPELPIETSGTNSSTLTVYVSLKFILFSKH